MWRVDVVENLLSSGDATCTEALINTESNVSWDETPEGIDVASVDGSVTTESSSDDVGSEAEEGLGDGLNTGVFTGEASNEDTLCAERVELGVHCAHGEDGHLVLGKVVDDSGRTVLEGELGDQGTLDDNVDLRATRMDVGSVEATGSEEPKSH